MHHNTLPNHKSSLLSLVAGVHSRSYLTNIGFDFSKTQYHTALQKVQKQDFSLKNYQRYVPPSRSKVSQNILHLINEYLLKNSRQSSNFTSKDELIYYLEKTIRDTFYQMKSEHPEVKSTLSTFYKLCPGNFKKACKKTDM